MAFEMRVVLPLFRASATVVNAEPVPKAKKLLKLDIDLGERRSSRQNDECNQRERSHENTNYHVDEHGVGSHFAPFGSRLKSVLVTNGPLR